MNPIRREVLNGLFVLVVASLLSVAFAAFQVHINVQVWVLILIGVAVGVSGYVIFETTLGYLASTDTRERAWEDSTRLREEEWLKRVGNPARLELGLLESGAGTALILQAFEAMKPGTDFTLMFYVDRDGGRTITSGMSDEARQSIYDAIMNQVKRGTIREYKRLICYDHDVFANDPELRSGILRVGEGPGTINRSVAEHCRLMLETRGCSVYVAPVVLRNNTVAFFGTDTVSITFDTADQDTGTRTTAGAMFFYDPPNSEIIEQLRRVERATEKRMVAVHKIHFPEDVER